jgi:hypothetical protein
MLDLVLLIFFFVMSYRVFVGIRREAIILDEFRLKNGIARAALLFPFGPLILLIGPSRLAFPLAYIVATACYLPAFLIARRYTSVLEIAGTDRVQVVQATVQQASGTALLGLAYVGVMFIWFFAAATI